MATRMGFYTGKIYDSSTDVKSIKECCSILNEEVLKSSCGDGYVEDMKVKLRKRCDSCVYGCEESNKSI